MRGIFEFVVKYPVWLIFVIPVLLNLLLTNIITFQYSFAIGGIVLIINSLIFIFSLGVMDFEKRKEIYNDWDKTYLMTISFYFFNAILLKFDISFINSFNLTINQNILMIFVCILLSFLSTYVNFFYKEDVTFH
jgi:hypothetical protein